MKTSHTPTHWVFYLEDGSKYSVGKYIEIFRENDGGIDFEGVATEQEAMDILAQNRYTE